MAGSPIVHTKLRAAWCCSRITDVIVQRTTAEGGPRGHIFHLSILQIQCQQISIGYARHDLRASLGDAGYHVLSKTQHGLVTRTLWRSQCGMACQESSLLDPYSCIAQRRETNQHRTCSIHQGRCIRLCRDGNTGPRYSRSPAGTQHSASLGSVGLLQTQGVSIGRLCRVR